MTALLWFLAGFATAAALAFVVAVMFFAGLVKHAYDQVQRRENGTAPMKAPKAHSRTAIVAVDSAAIEAIRSKAALN